MSLNLDKSQWTRVRFGDVVHNVNDTVRDPESAGIDRVIAMEHMDPGNLSISRWGTLEDGTSFSRRVRPGQTLFGKRRAYQRKVAFAGFDAICSGDILTFEADESKMLAEFLPFLVQSDAFFDHALGTSAGSLSPRTSWHDLAKFEFDLPPLDQQKHIADLLWTVDRHATSLSELRKQVARAARRFTSRRLSEVQETSKLSEVVSMRSGPSFAAADSHKAPVEGSIPVVGIPNTRPDGSFDLSQIIHVVALSDSVGLIDEASLVLIRTNGNRDRIGNVYLPPAEAYGHAVSAFQFLLKTREASDREYAFWVLSEENMQYRMSEAASGTVGLGNLAARWLMAQEVPWPSEPSDRASLVDEFHNAHSSIAQVERELRQVTSVASALSRTILGGS